MEIRSNNQDFRAKRLGFWILPLVVPVLLLLGWVLFDRQPHHDLKIHQEAPDFAVKTLDGASIQLSSRRGHWVLIDFWSTLCGPCVEMLPILNEFSEETKKKNVELIAVEIQANKDRSQQLKEQLHLSFLIGLDETRIASDYQVSTVPAMFLIDPQGRIRLMMIGTHSLTELRQIVQDVGI